MKNWTRREGRWLRKNYALDAHVSSCWINPIWTQTFTYMIIKFMNCNKLCEGVWPIVFRDFVRVLVQTCLKLDQFHLVVNWYDLVQYLINLAALRSHPGCELPGV